MNKRRLIINRTFSLSNTFSCILWWTTIRGMQGGWKTHAQTECFFSYSWTDIKKWSWCVFHDWKLILLAVHSSGSCLEAFSQRTGAEPWSTSTKLRWQMQLHTEWLSRTLWKHASGRKVCKRSSKWRSRCKTSSASSYPWLLFWKVHLRLWPEKHWF